MSSVVISQSSLAISTFDVLIFYFEISWYDIVNVDVLECGISVILKQYQYLITSLPPPSGIACPPAEKSLLLWITLIAGESEQSRPHTGPNLSALNSAREGNYLFVLWRWVGRNQIVGNGDFLSGSRPSGPRVPIVIVGVCPSPSGDLCSFSRVIPLLISALNCSVRVPFSDANLH